MRFVLVLLFAAVFTSGATLSPPGRFAAQQMPPRIAVIDLLGVPEEADVHRRLIELIGAEKRFRLAEDGFVKTALSGAAIELSLNMTRDQGVAAAQLLGCEYFVLDKYFAVTRRGLEGKSSGESMLALFLIDGRSGRLLRFDAAHEKAATEEEAVQRVRSKISGTVGQLLDAAAESERRRNQPDAVSAPEIFTLPEDGMPLAARMIPPKVLRKKSPVYPRLAEDAEITAIVRLSVQFLSNGTIGEVEVERWAGFGLDEASIAAARSAEFEPATLDGKPVSVVAPIEYHFRVGRAALERSRFLDSGF